MAKPKRPSEVPSRDRFARIMMDALREAGEKDEIEYVRQEFQLRAGAAHMQRVLNLANIYREYCQVSRPKRQETLGRYVRAWFISRLQLPTSLADACPDLLPCIRSRGFYETGMARMLPDDKLVPAESYRTLAEHLGIGLVYDLPESILQLQHQHLEQWKVSFDEAFEAACRNLREISKKEFDNPAPGVWQSAWRDNHDNGRLVLTDLLLRYEVRGDLVALVPDRDTLLLTGTDDELGLLNAAELAHESLQRPRHISGWALRWTGTTWEPFLPPPGHPAYERLLGLRVTSIGEDYNAQIELLRKRFEAKGEEVFPASILVVTDPKTGLSQTTVAWTDGLDTLLPIVDLVFLVQVRSETDIEIVAAHSWERIQEVVGHRLTPLGLYPERYRAQTFPTAEELTAIGKVMPWAMQ